MSAAPVNVFFPENVPTCREHAGRYAGSIEVRTLQCPDGELYEIWFVEKDEFPSGVIEGWQIGLKSKEPKFRLTRDQANERARAGTVLDPKEGEPFMVGIKVLIDALFEQAS